MQAFKEAANVQLKNFLHVIQCNEHRHPGTSALETNPFFYSFLSKLLPTIEREK